jgi:hypothetical protein
MNGFMSIVKEHQIHTTCIHYVHHQFEWNGNILRFD